VIGRYGSGFSVVTVIEEFFNTLGSYATWCDFIHILPWVQPTAL
jgi:hypothetical protein